MSESMQMGGSIVSKNIWEKRARIKWIFREKSVNDVDNGWRFLSEIDTDEYLADSKNMVVCSWEAVLDIEPAIEVVFDLPVGTELTLVYADNKKYFINSETGERVELFPL